MCQGGGPSEAQGGVRGRPVRLVPLRGAKHTASGSWVVQPEMKASRPQKGQNVSIQDIREKPGLSWAESQPPGLSPLPAVGPHQEMEPTHNFTTKFLGKSDGFVHRWCG